MRRSCTTPMTFMIIAFLVPDLHCQPAYHDTFSIAFAPEQPWDILVAALKISEPVGFIFLAARPATSGFVCAHKGRAYIFTINGPP